MKHNEQAIKDAGRRYQQTERAHDKAREDLAAVIIEALKAGERPTDVTAWSPFTPAYIRRLARDHGIKAAKTAKVS